MSFLVLLLMAKIVVTVVFVAVPFLLFPVTRIDQVMGLRSDHALLYRLYGVAMLALLTAYSSALVEAWGGGYPHGILLMGLVSNAGATITIVTRGAFTKMRVLTLFFGTIAAGIAIALVMPEAAMARF